MKRLLVLAAAAAALIASPAAADVQMQPGLWRVEQKVTSVEMENAPPGMADAARRSRVSQDCITPEEAAAGPSSMFKNDRQCRLVRESSDGGRYEAVVVCNQDGGTSTVTLTGNFGATRFELTAAMEITGRRPMKLTVVMTGERLGECR